MLISTLAGNYKVQLYDPQTKGYADYPGIGMHVEVKDPDDNVSGPCPVSSNVPLQQRTTTQVSVM